MAHGTFNRAFRAVQKGRLDKDAPGTVRVDIFTIEPGGPMFVKVVPAAAAALILSAGLAVANDAATIQQSSSEMAVPIYSAGSSTNYCPAGLQPVSVDGTTSCGTPTSDMTYAEVKATPYGRRSSSYVTCAPGVKGC